MIMAAPEAKLSHGGCASFRTKWSSKRQLRIESATWCLWSPHTKKETPSCKFLGSRKCCAESASGRFCTGLAELDFGLWHVANRVFCVLLSDCMSFVVWKTAEKWSNKSNSKNNVNYWPNYSIRPCLPYYHLNSLCAPLVQLLYYFYQLLCLVTCDHHKEMSISSATVRQCDKAKILFRIAILGLNLTLKALKILCQRLHKAMWPITNGPTLHFGRPCDLWLKSWSKWYSTLKLGDLISTHIFQGNPILLTV